ncbi:MAG: NAD(P)H-hydrate dehydratase [Odoribacter sp.]|nr:NAD(P)H-hydrate dehydratase [Odoribacter sp.]
MMNKLFKTSQIPEIDKYTIENEPIDSINLMERAAFVWTEKFIETFEKTGSVSVLAGSGNNGGDGYVIACLLEEKGWEVNVWDLSFSKNKSKDCEANYKRYHQIGGKIIEITDSKDIRIEEKDIIIDAIFGSGLDRAITGELAEIIQKINTLSNIKVAVDMPSGLMGEDNSKNDKESIIKADYTFTFQFPKLAFMFAENEEYIGKWEVLDIGLSPQAIKDTVSPYYYLTEDKIKAIVPKPSKFSHKGTNGHGLLVAGSYGMMGAAVLGAKAAVSSGIGLLSCHIPVKGVEIVQTSVPEALINIDACSFIYSEGRSFDKYNAVALGPALGRDPLTAAGIKKLLTEWRGMTIIDADALNIMSDNRELLSLLHEKCILTPHPKEFERLAGKSANDFDRLNKLSNFAVSHSTYIILKGAYTVIATPEGEFYFNTTGNPGMAKGGMGDVLTGVLLALASGKMSPLHVCMCGVFAHGLTGDILVERTGVKGLHSQQVAEKMGKAWKRLEN